MSIDHDEKLQNYIWWYRGLYLFFIFVKRDAFAEFFSQHRRYRKKLLGFFIGIFPTAVMKFDGVIVVLLYTHTHMCT